MDLCNFLRSSAKSTVNISFFSRTILESILQSLPAVCLSKAFLLPLFRSAPHREILNFTVTISLVYSDNYCAIQFPLCARRSWPDIWSTMEIRYPRHVRLRHTTVCEIEHAITGTAMNNIAITSG